MQEIKDITRSITAAVAALQAQIEQAGYKVQMPVPPVQIPTSVEVNTPKATPQDLPGMVPAFAQALKDAGFAPAFKPALKVTPQVPAIPGTTPMGFPETPKAATTTPLRPIPDPLVTSVTVAGEENKTLMTLIIKFKGDRDGFCKAAKGLVPGMKSNDLRRYYMTQRKIGMADGSWPKPVPPPPKVKAVTTPALKTDEVIAKEANGLTATPEPVAEPEKVNGFTAPSIPVVTPVIPTLNDQVQALRKAEVEKAMNPAVAKIEGQIGQDAAANKHNSLLQLARTQARALGANGPISIDEVTAAMAATSNVLPTIGKQLNQWKGRVFPKSEWVCVGSKATSMVSSHARQVGVWALKSWLKSHSLHGTAATVSAYNLFGIYKTVSHVQRTLLQTAAERFNWFIGDEQLASELRATINKDTNTLYGIPVSFIPGAVGAILMPPDPAKGVERTQK